MRSLRTWNSSRSIFLSCLKTLVSVDFSVVPTIRFQILYVFLVLAHERRRIVHFAVTAHPTAEWTAQQMREAFPRDTPPRYLLRDRDRIFGQDFVDLSRVTLRSRQPSQESSKPLSLAAHDGIRLNETRASRQVQNSAGRSRPASFGLLRLR